MSERRQLTTDDQRQWLFRAKEYGGLCAACGRVLLSTEAVYVEQVDVELKYASAEFRRITTRNANLGQECASATFLAQASLLSVDPCEGCGRPVFYEVDRARRTRTYCSRRCIDFLRLRARQAERGRI
jgi:hypothetical protein